MGVKRSSTPAANTSASCPCRKEIMSSDDPEEMRRQKVEEYKAKFANPYVAAARGYVDAVIEPKETRRFLMHAIKVSDNKVVKMVEKKHGLPPL